MLKHEQEHTCRTVSVQTAIKHPHLTTLPGQQTYGAEWAGKKKGIKPFCDCVWTLFSELILFKILMSGRGHIRKQV